MALKTIVAALTMVVAASATATRPEPNEPAPTGTETTRYCMKIEITGSRVEKVRCWTRAEWAEQEVDVDKEWAREGVRVIS
jgi:hypothetical protein